MKKWKIIIFLIVFLISSKWGESSTVLTLNATSNSGYLRDDHFAGCSGSGADSTTGNYIVGVGRFSSVNGHEKRTFLEFDGSPIPDGETVTAATIYTYIQGGAGNSVESGNAIVYQINYGTLGNSDFQLATGTQEGTIFTESSPESAYSALDVSTAYISKTGTFQYTIRADFACADADDQWFNGDSSFPNYIDVTYGAEAPATVAGVKPIIRDIIVSDSTNFGNKILRAIS